MNVAQLFQTLLAVALGGLIGFASSYLVEKRREATARRTQLRSAYSRWLALHATTSLDLELLTQLTREMSYRDSVFLELIAQELQGMRSGIRSLIEHGYDVLALEQDAQLRSVVTDATETTRKVFRSANNGIRAHQAHAYMSDKVRKLQSELNDLPADDPRRADMAANLSAIQTRLAEGHDSHLARSHEHLSEIIRVNAEQVELVRQITEKVSERR
jgi:hypothetical protein